jgi:Uma2 family endonuclease
MTLAIELPARDEQEAFNLKVWKRLLADPEMARIEGRIETNRHGQIIMTPPPGPPHGGRQASISIELHNLIGGKLITECPISTSNGVRAADVGWFSSERFARAFNKVCFLEAPEICVEVLSPSNTRKEIEEKAALYFDAGAEEVWICELDGTMRWQDASGALERSRLCSEFPVELE